MGPQEKYKHNLNPENPKPKQCFKENVAGLLTLYLFET